MFCGPENCKHVIYIITEVQFKTHVALMIATSIFVHTNNEKPEDWFIKICMSCWVKFLKKKPKKKYQNFIDVYSQRSSLAENNTTN